jgi:hypothetical protein
MAPARKPDIHALFQGLCPENRVPLAFPARMLA